LFEALRYKPEGRGFDSRWYHWNFSLTYSFRCRTVVLGSTQPLTEVSKSVPLQVWSGPEGSRKLRFPDFVTMAQDGGKFCHPYVLAAFTRKEMLLVLVSVRG
jgi:hypothetical protein